EAFETAVAAARALGWDLRPVWRSRLAPTEARPWNELLRDADADTVTVLLDEAARLLPGNLAAEEEGGLLPSTVSGQVLSSFLERLATMPGVGGACILAGLDSPVVRHRNLALRALAAWSQDRWPSGAHERVARMAADDPAPSVRAGAAAAWGEVAEA
ncbi:MAG: hypothetical protein D6798_20000, partial [Deltaproteobacteria bacterium]